ncbi:UV DNA damage repair endonuclease UvsE [bacterium]|nr:UV DNA damage repair endonuclease UvsE [bacterium]
MRIGYACVNAGLTSRSKKLGGPITTSRTARKATWYPDNYQLLGERALLNATDLLHYLQWNEEHNIRLFRIGSELIPWHDQFELSKLPQLQEIKDRLFEAGEYARAHGHRLTTHPGPFHVLGSPNLEVAERSIIGLERHSEMFDMMGYEPSFENKINIHVGGMYNDAQGTADRWIASWHRLSDNLKKRLVLENDDKPGMWSVQMLYDYFHREIGIPITFDYFHHSFHTSDLTEEQALKLAATTWPEGVTQCTHYSESRRDEKKRKLLELCDKNNIEFDALDDWPTFAKLKHDWGKIRVQAHADYCKQPINTYGLDIDIVLEAKAKENALFESLRVNKSILDE